MLQQFLRTFVLTTALTIPSITLQAFDASADQRDFYLINNNDLTVAGLYVSSIKSKSWGANVLEEAVGDGQRSLISFNNGSTQCVYDIRVIYEDSSCTIIRRVNLCTTRALTLKGDGGERASNNCR